MFKASAIRADDLEKRVKDSRATNSKLSKELARIYDALAKIEHEDERVLSKLAEQQMLNDKLDNALEVQCDTCRVCGWGCGSIWLISCFAFDH